MKIIFLIEYVLFYIFFFVRANLLSKRIGKKIKADTPILNIAIFFAGLSAVFFILGEFFPEFKKVSIEVYQSVIMDVMGLILITLGFLFSAASSINLGASWRIGVHESESTELVTTGLYQFSRNPYFTSYDVVLIGSIIASGSVMVMIFSLVTIVLFHILILREEKYLEQVHQEKYENYKNKVRRYF